VMRMERDFAEDRFDMELKIKDFQKKLDEAEDNGESNTRNRNDSSASNSSFIRRANSSPFAVFETGHKRQNRHLEKVLEERNLSTEAVSSQLIALKVST